MSTFKNKKITIEDKTYKLYVFMLRLNSMV